MEDNGDNWGKAGRFTADLRPWRHLQALCRLIHGHATSGIQLQYTEVYSCSIQKYTAAVYRSIQLQYTEVYSCNTQKYTAAIYRNTAAT